MTSDITTYPMDDDSNNFSAAKLVHAVEEDSLGHTALLEQTGSASGDMPRSDSALSIDARASFDNLRPNIKVILKQQRSGAAATQRGAGTGYRFGDDHFGGDEDDGTADGGMGGSSGAAFGDDRATGSLDVEMHEQHGSHFDAAEGAHESDKTGELVEQDLTVSEAARYSSMVPGLAKLKYLVLAAANFGNTIATAGVAGMPWAAAHSGGLFFGLVVLVIFGVVADYSYRSIIRYGVELKCLSYASLAKKVLGKKGEWFLRAAVLMLSIGTTIGYAIIIRDTIPLPFYLQNVVLGVVTLCLLFPLSSFRNLEKLGNLSLVALTVNFTVVIFIGIKALSVLAADEAESTAHLVNPAQGLEIEAVGAVCFAFVCHHNSFLIFADLYNETPGQNVVYAEKGWKRVTHSSMLLVVVFFVCECALAMIAFGREALPDNIMVLEDISIVLRLMLALCMALTFPLESIVARDTIHSIILNPLRKNKDQESTRWTRWAKNHAQMVRCIEAFVLCIFIFLCAVSIRSLSVVQVYTGGLSASLLGFIIPGAILKKEGKMQRTRMNGVLLMIFGLLVLVAAVVGQTVTLFTTGMA